MVNLIATQTDYLSIILESLDEDFIAVLENGSRCKQIPHNILKGVAGTTLEKPAEITTKSLLYLFIKTQSVFLYEDEYFSGYQYNTVGDEGFKTAFRELNMALREKLGDSYDNLPYYDNPMKIISECCVNSFINSGGSDMRKVIQIINQNTKEVDNIVGLRYMEKFVEDAERKGEPYKLYINGIEKNTEEVKRSLNIRNTQEKGITKLETLTFGGNLKLI